MATAQGSHLPVLRTMNKNSNSTGWYTYFELFTSNATAQTGTLTSNHNMNSNSTGGYNYFKPQHEINSTGWYTYFDLFTSIATAQAGTLTSTSSHQKQQHRLAHLLRMIT
jgi:hypothetical protein